MSDYLTAQEAAERLKCTVHKVMREARAGRFPNALNPDDSERIRIPESDLFPSEKTPPGEGTTSPTDPKVIEAEAKLIEAKTKLSQAQITEKTAELDGREQRVTEREKWVDARIQEYNERARGYQVADADLQRRSAETDKQTSFQIEETEKQCKAMIAQAKAEAEAERERVTDLLDADIASRQAELTALLPQVEQAKTAFEDKLAEERAKAEKWYAIAYRIGARFTRLGGDFKRKDGDMLLLRLGNPAFDAADNMQKIIQWLDTLQDDGEMSAEALEVAIDKTAQPVIAVIHKLIANEKKYNQHQIALRGAR